MLPRAVHIGRIGRRFLNVRGTFSALTDRCGSCCGDPPPPTCACRAVTLPFDCGLSPLIERCCPITPQWDFTYTVGASLTETTNGGGTFTYPDGTVVTAYAPGIARQWSATGTVRVSQRCVNGFPVITQEGQVVETDRRAVWNPQAREWFYETTIEPSVIPVAYPIPQPGLFLTGTRPLLYNPSPGHPIQGCVGNFSDDLPHPGFAGPAPYAFAWDRPDLLPTPNPEPFFRFGSHAGSWQQEYRCNGGAFEQTYNSSHNNSLTGLYPLGNGTNAQANLNFNSITNYNAQASWTTQQLGQCNPNPCDLNQTGACCRLMGVEGLTLPLCSHTTLDQCRAQRGLWRGVGTSCDTARCQPLGACCLASGACLQLGRVACFQRRGVYRGDGTFCDQGRCNGPVGACCVNGGCLVTSAGNCAAVQGIYRGDGSPCSTANCGTNPDLGSCCADGRCFPDVTLAGCLAKDGIWQRDVPCVNRRCVIVVPNTQDIDPPVQPVRGCSGCGGGGTGGLIL